MSLDRMIASLRKAAPDFPPGPLAIVLDEDGVALSETLDHLLARGFAQIVLNTARAPALTPAQAARVFVLERGSLPCAQSFGLIDAAIAAMPGRWMHYCYNAEFLHYPFCETRSVGEMLAFHAEERREAMITFAIDLYAMDLQAHPDGVDIVGAHMDRAGYYGLQRQTPDWAPMDRQWDFYGGLRWRFEEHLPEDRRRIDRVGLFRARPGLQILPNHTTTIDEYNTISCPWHHSLTAAILSFRVAKALRLNPGSRDCIARFAWPNAVPFTWSSRQLMDLGLIEPGQWF